MERELKLPAIALGATPLVGEKVVVETRACAIRLFVAILPADLAAGESTDTSAVHVVGIALGNDRGCGNDHRGSSQKDGDEGELHLDVWWLVGRVSLRQAVVRCLMDVLLQ